VPRAEIDDSQPTEVKIVRLKIIRALLDPINGEAFKERLNINIQIVIGGRVFRKCGFLYLAENSDKAQGESLIYDQRACEIYQGKVFLGQDKWEDHSDIRARGQIPVGEYRVSGELFFMKNLPAVPIIRCDGEVLEQDRACLNKDYVLLDARYNLI
jgi:hypothetical protein